MRESMVFFSKSKKNPDPEQEEMWSWCDQIKVRVLKTKKPKKFES